MEINDIIKKCIAQDRQSEKVLFSRLAPRVLTLCRRYATRNSEADDLMQECFIHLYDKIHLFNPNKGAFEGWVHRLCTNKILTLIRPAKRKINLVYPGELPEKEISPSEFSTLPAEKIIAAIQTLPLGYKQVFNLNTFDNYTHKEIAIALNITEATSRSQLTKARRNLRLILKTEIDKNYERELA